MPCCTQDAAALNEDGKKRKIVVTGCLAQRYNEQLAEQLPEADMVGRLSSHQYQGCSTSIGHPDGGSSVLGNALKLWK